jgi:hypothetical protein
MNVFGCFLRRCPVHAFRRLHRKSQQISEGFLVHLSTFDFRCRDESQI